MDYKKEKFSLLLLILGMLFVPGVSYSDMTGGNFEIYADTFSILSDELVTGGTFTVYDTAGEFGAITSVNGAIELRGGFQAMEKGFLTFDLSENAINLGTLSSSTISSDTIVLTVSTDSETGYSVTLQEDGNLRTATDDIDDVGDGSVTAGSEEYGLETSGTDALVAADTAITNGLPIASATGTVTNALTDLIFKASIDGSTAEGSYAHTVTLTGTVNP